MGKANFQSFFVQLKWKDIKLTETNDAAFDLILCRKVCTTSYLRTLSGVFCGKGSMELRVKWFETGEEGTWGGGQSVVKVLRGSRWREGSKL